MRKRQLFSILVAFGILSCFVLSASLVVAEELSAIPLLDTPGNKTYYDELLASVKNADSSIKVMMATAVYYPEYPEGLQDQLYDALEAAEARGVRVRIILDESSWSEEVTKGNKKTANHLRSRGLDVKFEDPEVTTHGKLVIVDEEVTLIGSSNWNFPTYTETYQTNIKLKSKKVAGYYGDLFDAVWTGKKFNRLDLPEITGERAVVPLVSVGDHREYFEAVRELIGQAEESIDLLVFKITRYSGFGESKSNLLTEKLVEAKNRGVEVRIILDISSWSKKTSRSNRETTLWFLGEGLGSVKFDSPDTTTHGKLLIIDGETIVLGSTNWSYYSLAKNRETDLVIKDVPQLAEAYEVYFEQLWKKARLPAREELSGRG